MWIQTRRPLGQTSTTATARPAVSGARRAQRLALLTLLAVSVVAGTGCGPKAELPPLPIVDTESLLDDVATQLEKMSAAVERRPRDAGVNGEYGLVLATYGRDQEAQTALERARLLQPRDSQWANFHSFVLRRLGEPEAALEAIDAALAQRPAQVDYLVRKAQLLYDLGRFEEAAPLLRNALEQSPRYPLALFYLGRIDMIDQNWTQAIDRFQQLLTNGIQVEEVHFNLSQAYRMTGDADRSQLHLQHAQNSGSLKISGYDPVYMRLADLNVGDQPHILRATEFYRSGKIARAVEEMAIAHSKNPDNIGTHVHLVRMYGHNGELDKALFHYEAASAIDPDFNQLDSNLGFAYQMAKQYDKAADAYARAVTLQPTNAQLQAQLGLMLAQSGQAAAAFAPLERSLELSPNQRNLQVRLGELWLEQGEPDTAKRYLSAALEPEDQLTIVVLQRLADAYLDSQDAVSARSALTRALSIAEQYRNTRAIEALTARLEQL